jgi:uncharacterized repeat protein (TIGR01451 family)
MLKRVFLVTVMFVSFLLPFAAEAQLPLPARIGGIVMVNGIQLTQETDTGYTFIVTKGDGALYVPSAQDTDGLNTYNYYLIDIPIYDATHQPEGAHPGDTAVIHAYKDGVEVTLESPANGLFWVGQSGSYAHMDLGVTTVDEGADLSIDKSAQPVFVTADETFTYTITVTNNGPSPAVNVEVVDTLPVGVADVAASGDGWSCTISGQMMTCTRASLNPGVSSAINIELTAPSEGGSITNSAEVTSDTPDPEAGNNSDSLQTTVNASADLTITKDGPESATAGGPDPVMYAITIGNAGPSTAENVVLTDAIPSGLTNPEYSTDEGDTWQPWTGSVNFGTIEKDGLRGVLIKATVTPSATGTISNTASVNSDTDDPNVPNSSTKETTVESSADLSVMKSAPDSVMAGENFTYTITVENSGPSTAVHVVLTDSLPPEILSTPSLTYFVDGEEKGGWPGQVFMAALAVGESKEVKITGTVAPATTGALSNTVTVSSETDDPVAENNSHTEETVVTAEADVEVTKTGPPKAAAGEHNFTYTITMTNAGPSDAVNVVLTDNVPSGIHNPEYSTGTDNWTGWTGSLNLGALSAGDSMIILIRGTIDADAPGTITNTARVSADTEDPNSHNNSDSVDTENITDDGDQDGLPDDWEQQIIDADPDDDIMTIEDVLPGDDFDGDGFTNLEEYMGGTLPADENDYPTRPYVVTADCSPYDGQGEVEGSLRVPNDTSVVIRVKDDTGIDPATVQMTVKGGSVSPVLKQVVGNDKDYWVIYNPAVTFSYGELVPVTFTVANVDGISMTTYSYSFQVESEAEHTSAQANIPESALDDTNPDEHVLSAASGTSIEGAVIKYDPDEDVTPRFGPVGEIPELDKANGVGIPVALEPPTVFENPVTIFIPCPGETDVSTLDVYYYNPSEGWVKAEDADGWMVSGSRVNHNETTPPTIEIKVNHFSGVQSGHATMLLKGGWNLISLCRDPVDHAIESVLAPIEGTYYSVWAFENNDWRVYDPIIPGFTDLTIIKSGLGYWIHMIEAAPLSVGGTEAPKNIHLVKGWNLVGYPCCKAQPIHDAFASIKGNYDLVWCFQNNSWKVYDPKISGLSDIHSMVPGYGYWINMKAACAWTVTCP